MKLKIEMKDYYLHDSSFRHFQNFDRRNEMQEFLNKESSASRRLLIETFMEELTPILFEKNEFQYRVISISLAAYGTLPIRSRIYVDRTEDFETK